MRYKLLLILFMYIGLNSVQAEELPAFKNETLSVEERLNDLVSRMTIEEKIDMLAGYNDFYLHPVERLGIPAFEMADGPLGIASWGLKGQGTAFPATLAATASWDPKLMNRMGDAMGQEWRSRGIHFWLAPGVNMYRASKGARNFEYMGEDPYLASEMVVPLISSVQENGVVATVKHYAANDQEFDRYTVSSEVDERTLREIYLPPFKAAIQEAGAWAVMTGYNPVNGEWNTQNKFLIDILKKEWEFKGLLMSDWACTYSAVEAANNGLDLECGSKSWFNRDKLLPLIKEGKITEETIDDKVRRIFRPCFTLGFFDRPQEIDSIPRYNEFANETALQTARDGSVLLKNENKFLPLNANKIKKIAIIGPTAQPPVMTDRRYREPISVFGGGGSSKVNPWYTTYTLEGVRNLAGDQVEVLYDQGISNRYLDRIYKKSIFWTEEGVKGLKASYYENSFENEMLESNISHWHYHYGNQLKVSTDKVAEDKAAVRWEAYVKPEKSGMANFFINAEGAYQLFINDELLADCSKSQSYASSVIPYEFKEGEKINIKLEFKRSCNFPSIKFGYDYQLDFANSEAVKIAKEADVVVFCAGYDHILELEGKDRDFSLPYGQELLLEEILKVNPETATVIIAGGGVDMNNSLSKTKAILHAWYPGMEGGKAIAEILFGKVNPSGKLPITIEKHWKDSPAFGNYDEERGTGKVHYREGLFVGYRHFDVNNIEPLFPFGYGLSYTDFELSEIELSASKFKANEVIELEINVKNTGDVAGAEVVQLYIGQEKCKYERPVKELKAFKKVFLESGESQIVKLKVDKNDFKYFNPKLKKWQIDSGKFNLKVGTSSRDIVDEKTITYKVK